MALPRCDGRRSPCATVLIGLAAAVVFFASDCLHAADFLWISPTNASYSAPAAWMPSVNAPPGTADQAVFNRYSLGGGDETSVGFTASPTNSRIIVRDDAIHLDLAGFTYRLTNSSAATPSIVVAEQSGNIGDLRIDGGRLESNYATLGLASGSDGIVVVESATWANAQSMLLGAGGVGELIVDTGSQVTAGRITLGDQATATGYATVSDDGTLLGSSQQLVVGASGRGELYIYDGATVNSFGAAIARDADSSGIVTLVGGAWNNQGTLDIGGGASATGGLGDLVIDFGATVTSAGRTRVWDNGLLSIRGGTLVTPSLENHGGIEYLVGVLEITDSNFVVGDSGVLGAIIALTPDMHTIIHQDTTVDANGHIAAIEGTFTSGTLTNNGRLSVVDGAMQFERTSTNAATGRISVVNGTLATGAGAANRLTNQGRIDLLDAVLNGGLHNAAGGTVTTAGGVAFNGQVSGDGQFSSGGLVTFNGSFDPGAAATIIEFGGDVTFTADNTLQLQIGGPTAGAQFDQLSVAGSAALAGTLDVKLIGSFLPAAGQSFPLIEYDVHAGTFSTVILPDLPMPLEWSLDYGDTALVLSVGSTTMTGDLNMDGSVNRADVAILVGNYGLALAATASQGDLNGDGVVSLSDLIVLKSHLSSPSDSPAAVPEPSAYMLAMLGAALIATSSRRWRRR